MQLESAFVRAAAAFGHDMLEPQGLTRTQRIAENKMALQAAGAHYLSFATGIPGRYELIESQSADDRKVDARTIFVEESGAGLIVRSGKKGPSFPFEWLFHSADACPFPADESGRAQNELHSFIRRVAQSEIGSISASASGATSEILSITYFEIGGACGLFHMKDDGRHGCVIQQYECDNRMYVKIVSLDPRHTLATASVPAGTYIRIENFKGVEIPEGFQEIRGKERIEHMLAFRDFVAGRMTGRKARKIPAKVEEMKVEDHKVPLLTLATNNGKPVEQAPDANPEERHVEPVVEQKDAMPITDFVIGQTIGRYFMKSGKRGMVISQRIRDKKMMIRVESIDPKHILVKQGVTAEMIISSRLVTCDEAVGALRGNIHAKGAPEKLALASFIRENLTVDTQRKTA